MQTRIKQQYLNTADGQTADRILRNCVHCGFCTATCPTYQLLSDELDGPRGRIYLIKQLLEGDPATSKTRNHLDRCLTCRNCETTCPSGVEYGHLLDIGRALVEQQTSRPLHQRLVRQALLWALPNPDRFAALVKLGRAVRFLLPASLKHSIPATKPSANWPKTAHARKVLLLEGCVQPALSPEVNQATARLLDKLGIETQRVKQSCCGALAHHLNAAQQTEQTVRDNIDHWWPYVEQGIEAIVSNASGCGVMVKDYGHLLHGDAVYADKARTIASLCKDISEIVATAALPHIGKKRRIVFQSSCTLQHGQKLAGVVEGILSKAGFELLEQHNRHLCCGSAGTYSITQPTLSQRLLKNKLTYLLHQQPELITTANIGCLLHLRSRSPVPVKHWVELVDEALDKQAGKS